MNKHALDNIKQLSALSCTSFGGTSHKGPPTNYGTRNIFESKNHSLVSSTMLRDSTLSPEKRDVMAIRSGKATLTAIYRRSLDLLVVVINFLSYFVGCCIVQLLSSLYAPNFGTNSFAFELNWACGVDGDPRPGAIYIPMNNRHSEQSPKATQGAGRSGSYSFFWFN